MRVKFVWCHRLYIVQIRRFLTGFSAQAVPVLGKITKTSMIITTGAGVTSGTLKTSNRLI